MLLLCHPHMEDFDSERRPPTSVPQTTKQTSVITPKSSLTEDTQHQSPKETIVTMSPKTNHSPTDAPDHITSQSDLLDRTGLDSEEHPARTSKEDTTTQEQPDDLSPGATTQDLASLPTSHISTRNTQNHPSNAQETNDNTNRTPPSQSPNADPHATNPPPIIPPTTAPGTLTATTEYDSVRATIALAFTSYVTFKVKHSRRIRRCEANNSSNLRLVAELSNRLEPYVERQRQGLLSAARDAEVASLVAQLSEMVQMVERQIGMTAEMQRVLDGVGVLSFGEEARRTAK